MFPKRALLLTAIVLRRVIWNWMESFPMEFVQLCQSQKKIEGNPEVLFDHFNNISDSTRKKVVFWPTQTMLLVLCPDILYSIGMASLPSSSSSNTSPGGSTAGSPNLSAQDQARIRALSNSVMTKRASAFLDTLKKSMKSKLADVATVCYVDICRASTFVSKADGSALRMIVPNVEMELR
ncbi:Ras GTPase activating protein ira2, partial [Quaeritorhiza haematococci]